MPALDGVELIERLLRRHVELPAIPIAAKATGEICRRPLQAGFSQVLEKPLDNGSLIDCIRCALAACPARGAKGEAPEAEA